MAAPFNNTDSLFAFLQKKIEETLMDEVADQVRFEEQRQIERVVYDAYPNPHIYERRRFNHGGLQDIDMMVATLEKRGSQVLLSVVNETRGQDQEDLYLAPLIEYGDNNGYGEYQYKYNSDHTSWQYLQSRPFTEETILALKRSGKHITAMRDGIRARGINVE